jgi:hypothetical protein
MPLVEVASRTGMHEGSVRRILRRATQLLIAVATPDGAASELLHDSAIAVEGATPASFAPIVNG